MHASTILIGDALVVAGLVTVFGHRLIKNYHRKVETPNAFMIKNEQSGLVIRPQNAGIADGVPIIQFTPQNWECTTWQMIEIGPNTFLLKDLYTQKSFAPVGTPDAGALLEQRPIGGDRNQHWQFNHQEDDTYTIQLAGTDLFITSTSSTVDDRLTLQEASDGADQRWTLTQQHPII
jgi:hypothetical protein